MKLEIKDQKLDQIKADLELVFVVKKNLNHKWVNRADFKFREFKGEADQVALVEKTKKLYVGIDSLDQESLRLGAGLAVKSLLGFKFQSLKVGLYGTQKNNLKAMVEGFYLGSYFFDRYLKNKRKKYLKTITFSREEFTDKKVVSLNKLKQEIKTAEIISGAVNYARDLVNMPPSELTPVRLAELSRELAKKNKLQVTVRGENYLKKQGMGAFLAVSLASPYPPQLIHLIYKPQKAKQKITLVGKGLTYDTGGLSLKPSSSMASMKADESGACAILGIMEAVSRLGLDLEVHGIIGATENVISKHAYKPDDILTAKNGKTIEIKNTDAEGRLVLADCLCYAQELKPDYIIDLATLTGAAVVALGEYTIGVLGNDKNLKESLIKASEQSGELSADLPFNRYLRPLIKSEIADVSNVSSSSYGGAITAGIFLDEFIQTEYKNKWAHLDIAGPAFVSKAWGYNPSGGSGAGIRMMVQWLSEI